jgi:aspartyl/asparaginyl-tRNA synthetase
MYSNYKGVDDSIAFSKVVTKLRTFCLEKGFIEVSTQDRLSILAACEDPDTVATYRYAGEVWPLPQTGQMWLEYQLLTQPELPGVFTVSTSYRNEPNPVPGRHKLIFPMFEFEIKGGIEDLQAFEIELLEYMGFGSKQSFAHKTYDELGAHFKTDELTHTHEAAMEADFGPITFCRDFPISTSPFWNMKAHGDSHAHKIDVIMYGQETIGSAERSTDPQAMRRSFHTISEGKYAKKLYELFGEDRVNKELDDFLSLDFFPRSGGGIGMTRMIEAVKKGGNMNNN